MTDSNNQRSCAALGFCQSRKPACEGCTAQANSAIHSAIHSAIRFAPGVIERLPRLRRGAGRYWMRAGVMITILMLASAGTGLLLARALRWMGAL